jgi:hypothetical protein
LDAALATMRATVADVSDRVPASLETDQKRLGALDRQIQNLVDALAAGGIESTAVLDRVAQLEQERKDLQQRVDDQRALLAKPLELPDDDWVHKQLGDLASLLREELPRSALLLRRLLGRVTAHPIGIRGKKRGYAQLRFRVKGMAVLDSLLEGHLPAVVLEDAQAASGSPDARSAEIRIDLGGPSRLDRLAAEIDELRAKGVTWQEIGRMLDISPGNAWTARKRWKAAEADDSVAA